jgi:predicted metal-dependent peptidase
MEIGELKNDISDIQAVLAVEFPFIASLGSRCRIIATNKIETYAGVSKENYMLINPELWEKLSLKDRVYVFAHEVCHIAFQHHDRLGGRNPKIWNYATDGVINEILDEVLSREIKGITLSEIASYLHIDLDALKKASAEEIYDKLAQNAISISMSSANGKSEEHGDLTDIDAPSDGNVIQEGDDEINNATNGETKEKLWAEALAQAYSMQKSIGTIPEGLSRIVDQLLKPKIKWYNILKKEIAIGIGKNVVGDWRKRSRKVPDAFPGLRRETLPTIWNLVDTSGSIDEEQLKQFLSEIYAQARETRVKVIPFDATSYEVLEANTPTDVIREVARRLKGGGGTEIKDALEKTFKQMNYGDIVTILTDGDIWDKNKPEVLEIARKIKFKASTALVVYTISEVPFFKNIKLE